MLKETQNYSTMSSHELVEELTLVRELLGMPQNRFDEKELKHRRNVLLDLLN